MDLHKEISRMFREDYYLRNRVSSEHFYEFKDRVLALVDEEERLRQEKLQKLIIKIQKRIEDKLINIDKLTFPTEVIHITKRKASLDFNREITEILAEFQSLEELFERGV